MPSSELSAKALQCDELLGWLRYLLVGIRRFRWLLDDALLWQRIVTSRHLLNYFFMEQYVFFYPKFILRVTWTLSESDRSSTITILSALQLVSFMKTVFPSKKIYFLFLAHSSVTLTVVTCQSSYHDPHLQFQNL